MSSEDFDYTPHVLRVLRDAGRPISDKALWDTVMRSPAVPDSDRELYWTPPFEPGPYPHNIVKLKASVSVKTDMSGVFPDAPIMTTQDGYWLQEWGPLPPAEVRRREDLDRRYPDRQAEPEPKPAQRSGACYIATAVYGSYDAPPVVTLRRFRDDRMATSVVGRGLIRVYYALSPRIASRLGDAPAISAVVRRMLDSFVTRLDANGRR